jgi:N-acetylmuramoyl-L-alanine amidase
MKPSDFLFCTFAGDGATPPVNWVAEIIGLTPDNKSFSCQLMDTGQILHVDYSPGLISPWPATDDTGVQYLLNTHEVYELIQASPGQGDIALLSFPDGSKFICIVEVIGDSTTVQLFHPPYSRLRIDHERILETDWTVHAAGENYSMMQRCSATVGLPEEPIIGIMSGDGWWSLATHREAHPRRVGGNIQPFAIVVHTTDMTPDGFDGLIHRWSTEEGKRNGAHFVIGRDAQQGVIQLVSINRDASHAGGPGHGSFVAGSQTWSPNSVSVGIEIHCAGAVRQHNGEWRLFDEGRPSGAAIPASDVVLDPQRPGLGWHRITDYQYGQLNALLDGIESALEPMPNGCIAVSQETPPDYGIFPTGRIVGHVSLSASSRGDPWPPTCDWLRAR